MASKLRQNRATSIVLSLSGELCLLYTVFKRSTTAIFKQYDGCHDNNMIEYLPVL